MKRQSGFTVIEVTIFLGLTAMLFLIALFGTGAFVSQTRFSDGMRRLESYLQSQYEEVVNGVNPRDSSVTCTAGSMVSAGSSTPGTSECVLLGKLVRFSTGSASLESYYVVGTEPAVIDTSLSQNDLIASFFPRIVDTVNVDTFESPWGIEFVRGKRASGGPPVTAIAFLRSPTSSRVVTYIFNMPSLGVPLVPFVQSSQASNTTANFCFMSADNANKIAAIQLSNGQGSNTISTLFDTTVAASCQ